MVLELGTLSTFPPLESLRLAKEQKLVFRPPAQKKNFLESLSQPELGPLVICRSLDRHCKGMFDWTRFHVRVEKIKQTGFYQAVVALNFNPSGSL